MFGFGLYLAAFSLMAGTAASVQMFTNSATLNISSCPITYYGQKYDKVYLAFNNATMFTVCFKDTYESGVENDCIMVTGGTADRGDLAVLTKDIPSGSGVHTLLPNLGNSGKCVNVIPLRDSQQANISQIELGNFGAQAILAIKTFPGFTFGAFKTESIVDGQSVFSKTFPTNVTMKGVITDLSGCRHLGAVYKTNTTVVNTDICSSVTCDVRGNVHVVKQCEGDKCCLLKSTCTVSSNAIINFAGRLHYVPTRCAYSLLRTGDGLGLQVAGLLQERRRKDVAFLDRVILEKDGVQITLGPGTRVQVADKVLTLNATVQSVHGVMLSLKPSGVIAEVSNNGQSVSVHFDGNAVLIQMNGPSVDSVQGLCGNSSTVWSQESPSSSAWNEEKVSEHSASGCETLYTDESDSSIDCTAQTKRCNLMKEAPFASCHELIDPQPYITACRNVLCEYPEADGIGCQFLKNYALACGIKKPDWEAKTSCKTEPLCKNLYCSDHEFCGNRKNRWKPGCNCRAIYAAKYRSDKTFGEPTVCNGKSASVAMANCRLEEEGIRFSILHLNDAACVGKMDEKTHMVTFNFDNRKSCGTVVTAKNKQIMYKNTIMSRNMSTFGLINRHSAVHMDFSCYYTQPNVDGMAIKLKDSSVMQHITSGAWTYNLSMNAYTDSELTEPIMADTDIELDEKIFVELRTEGLDQNMVSVVTDKCWATNEPAPNGSLSYNLVSKGCPNPEDQTVRVEHNGIGMSNHFSFNMFQFTGEKSDLYLHCIVELCVRKDENNCVPTCDHGDRKRRSAETMTERKHHTIISMAWTS